MFIIAKSRYTLFEIINGNSYETTCVILSRFRLFLLVSSLNAFRRRRNNSKAIISRVFQSKFFSSSYSTRKYCFFWSGTWERIDFRSFGYVYFGEYRKVIRRKRVIIDVLALFCRPRGYWKFVSRTRPKIWKTKRTWASNYAENRSLYTTVRYWSKINSQRRNRETNIIYRDVFRDTWDE